MKPVALVLVGLAIGWIASGVEWNRESVAQTFDGPNNNGEIKLHPNNLVEDDYPRVKRFAVSAYGDGNKAGCFIVDSMTGRTWHASQFSGVREIVTQKK